MRWFKIAMFLLIIVLVTGNALAQDEVIARAYRTVNVRSGPGTQYDIIGQLNSGNEVQITGRSNDGSDWLRIDFQAGEGWVAFFTVTVLGITDQLPIVTPRVSGSSQPIRPLVTPTPTRSLSAVFVTAYRTVNVRSGPGLEYIRIGDLEAGSAADVTGKTNDSEWLRIDFSGKPGWVAFFVVSLTGSPDSIDVAEAPLDAATESPPNKTIDIITRYNVNLHDQPILGSQIIATVPFNTSLQADARADEVGSWLRVIYNDQIGWLTVALVSVHGDVGNLPVEQGN